MAKHKLGKKTAKKKMVKITQAKAKKILKDGTINGKKITAKQRKFFGLVAKGLFKKK